MKEYVLLVPSKIKDNIIKKVRKDNPHLNIKFLTLEEFIKKCTFDYDKKTIYFLMKEYNLCYSTALVYLNNLYYISDKLDSEKMRALRKIKKYLDDNNLLIYDNYFKDSIKNKEICIYNYDYITKYQIKILEDYNYTIINNKDRKYVIDRIYYARDIEDEVVFVANKISDLIKNGTDINKIKIIINKEYTEVVDRIFSLYHIPVNIKKSSIYSACISKKVLNNLDDLDNILDDIKDSNLYDKIIDILNSYSFISNKEEVKDLIENDFKNTFIYSNTKNCIENITLDSYIDNNDYVFLMGYNRENIPIVYKDDDYFSDVEKNILGIDTSTVINEKEREDTINDILRIKNLTITYKLHSSSSSCTKSNLLGDITTCEIVNNDYSNSHIMNKIFLTEKLDNLVKYNIRENDLNLLYTGYFDIPYRKYNNKYTLINKDNLYKYLGNELLLSYTSLDNYNRCKFRYYLDNILKINIVEDDFAIIVGNVCHYVLSSIDNNDFDTEKYFDKYLSTLRTFSKREAFFLNNIKEEMIFVINTIRKQLEYTGFDKKKYEEKVYVNMDRNIKVTFMGVIDKILYKEEDGINYLVVIDYKTGNANIKLDNIRYGIDMQLPIYLYLSSKTDLNNIKVVGFYLQKLFSSTLDNTKDYATAKEEKLKLEGYSIDDVSILSKFDKTFNDSKLIKSMKTSSNGFYKYSKILSKDDIEKIILATEEKVNQTVDNIIDADFDINPKVIDGENVSCKYCSYKDICYRRENDIVYINRDGGKDETRK
ncbi:MAG: PD-(D/E)XK nuclease family protein [Bacilli bacterium]